MTRRDGPLPRRGWEWVAFFGILALPFELLVAGLVFLGKGVLALVGAIRRP